MYLTGCVLAFVRHPIYGLSVYVALIYVHPPAQWWGSRLPELRWSLIAAGVTLAALMIQKTKPSSVSLFSFGVMKLLVLFLAWLMIQYFWALDLQMHSELIVLFAKYTLLVGLIYKCVENEQHLRVLLWTHSLGCFYLGIIVFRNYFGGRFEGFSGPGISEANVAGLLIVTGIITTFVLFLSGKLKEKLVAVGAMPFTLNALIATISRSGFLALGIAGVIFNLFAPKKNTLTIRIFSVAGLILLVSLTNATYWERIGTILAGGEQIEGVDTGSKRLVLMNAQLEMFKNHPAGCGHRCTAVLSPNYLDEIYLSKGKAGERARSSHNTFMSLMVEQGVPGIIFYLILLMWIARTCLKLRKRMRDRVGLIPLTYGAVVAILAAITVGDMFVDYLKFEARLWFIALLMVLVRMDAEAGNEGDEPAASDERRLTTSRR